MKAFYADYALRHSNKCELNRSHKHLCAKSMSNNLKKLTVLKKAKKELKGKRHRGPSVDEFNRPNKS